MTAPLGINQPAEIRSFFAVSAHPLRQCEKCGLTVRAVLAPVEIGPYNRHQALTVTHIFLLWAKGLISLADLAASGGRARDRTCSMKRVIGPRPSSGRLTLGMPDAPTGS